MSISLKKRPARKKRHASSLLERAQIAANSFCLRSYAVGFTGGVPRLLGLPSGEILVVPVVFTSPGYGIVGEVGVLAVDPVTLRVLGSTPVVEVRAAGARLAKEKRVELDAAFHRARTV